MLSQIPATVHECSEVCESFKEYRGRQEDHAMENGVKGHGGVWRLHAHTHTHTITHHSTDVHFPFSLSRNAHGHNFILRPISPPVILTMGGSNCALHGRPQELPLCIWLHSPLKTYRWVPGSEMETPHLAAPERSPGRRLQSKPPPQYSGAE